MPAFTPRKRADDSGVTLIEILVVLALIGIGAGIVSYALPSGENARTLEQEATLLAARLTNVADRSLVAGETYRVIWQSEAYASKRGKTMRGTPQPTRRCPCHIRSTEGQHCPIPQARKGVFLQLRPRFCHPPRVSCPLDWRRAPKVAPSFSMAQPHR